MTEKDSRTVLDEAMAEALESVEQREREAAARNEDDDAVEVEVDEGVPDEAEAEKSADDDEQQKLKDQLVRLAADFDNYRKRSRREVEDARKFGIESLLRNILPVVDNFERALSASGDEDHPIVHGIKMVHKQFADVLAQQGVKGFDSLGEIFDPELHEALSQFESAEHEPGEITNEHERGYMIHDRLLRPARVVVAMPPTPPPEEDAADPAPESEEA